MHKPLLIGAAFCFALSLCGAVQIDDTLQQVIAEKGQPAGKMQAGDALILRYPDQTVKLKGGKVVAVDSAKAAAGAATSTPAVAVAAKPAPAPAAAPADGLTWTTDYTGALADAKALNRHVFLFFTGSDWCGWCMRLNREILATPEFARYAQESLVLVELDFPRSKPQSPDVRRQNQTLQKKYQIEGYPTVVVLDRDGKPVGRLGYQEGGPRPFIKQLKSL